MTTNIQYPVNEVFATLQGEANFAGVPSVFIRLQGCNVGCGWCDTKHTWTVEDAQKVNLKTIIDKTGDKIGWANVTITQLVEHIQKNYPQIPHIVITGGEPANHDLQPLCAKLEQIGKNIQIETSGTEKLNITTNSWVTLSPKIDMPG
ncbi:MAG: radical SAM protein, partial [Burkholderiales bacterium]|nr:radical SAM protein [Burkholderiales bacterium]